MAPNLRRRRGWILAGCLSLLVAASAVVLCAQEPAAGIEEFEVGGRDPEAAIVPAGRIWRPCPFDWTGHPNVQILPRLGASGVPPGGTGYYSLIDAIRGELREKRKPSGYPPSAAMAGSFFDADFRYLDSVYLYDRSWSERLKRIRLGENFLFSTGGEGRWRFMNEHNSRLTEVDDSFSLGRLRIFGDVWYQDLVRVYAEFLAADRFSEELPPLPIDVNRGDLLNLFADVKLLEGGGDPVYVRVGRQELLFGSQRLVSPLDWANVRRTFQGVRLFRRTEKVDFDAFWTQFVPADPDDFDDPDEKRDFYGAWLTYRPQKGHFVDLYYLGFSNDNRVVQQGIVRAPTSRHTFGVRYAGDRGPWLWDIEGAVQLGRQGGQDVVAGMATAGGGYRFADVPLDPTFWIYYDMATGDGSPNAGDVRTFNQLFPFGHYYLGWADLVGRQNIRDLNLHLWLYPARWMTVWLQFHRYWLYDDRDALYNAAGNAFRRDPTGQAGNDVGHELDLVINFHIDAHSDIMTGYSKLYGGDFLQQTSGPNAAVDSELYFLMYNVRW